MERQWRGLHMARITLEICVDNLAGLDAAIAGGADRIELCQALALGGLTPSFAMMKQASRAAVPIYAMIRPRAGSFIHSDAEIALMIDDIARAREAGVAGVVFGAMDDDGRLHRRSMERFAKAAAGLGTTLHRVVDVLLEPAEEWLAVAMGLGIERVLTSGGAVTAIDGMAKLNELTGLAAGRISTMPGGGIRASNVATILQGTGATEVHSSCAAPASTAVQDFDFGQTVVTDGRAVAAMRLSLDAHDKD